MPGIPGQGSIHTPTACEGRLHLDSAETSAEAAVVGSRLSFFVAVTGLVIHRFRIAVLHFDVG